MNIRDIALKPAASAANNTINSGTGKKDDGVDFRTLFSSQLRQMKQDFVETGLTPADRALYAVGGEEVLKAKEELRERGSVLVTDAEDKEQESSKRQSELTASAHVPELETFRKHMPDGSIMFLTYEDGKLVEAEKRKPELIAKADYSRPAKLVDGTEKPQIKLVPRLNLFEDL